MSGHQKCREGTCGLPNFPHGHFFFLAENASETMKEAPLFEKPAKEPEITKPE